jgi:hypothetical protein
MEYRPAPGETVIEWLRDQGRACDALWDAYTAADKLLGYLRRRVGDLKLALDFKDAECAKLKQSLGSAQEDADNARANLYRVDQVRLDLKRSATDAQRALVAFFDGVGDADPIMLGADDLAHLRTALGALSDALVQED